VNELCISYHRKNTSPTPSKSVPKLPSIVTGSSDFFILYSISSMRVVEINFSGTHRHHQHVHYVRRKKNDPDESVLASSHTLGRSGGSQPPLKSVSCRGVPRCGGTHTHTQDTARGGTAQVPRHGRLVSSCQPQPPGTVNPPRRATIGLRREHTVSLLA
jgi:hypothetical protein